MPSSERRAAALAKKLRDDVQRLAEQLAGLRRDCAAARLRGNAGAGGSASGGSPGPARGLSGMQAGNLADGGWAAGLGGARGVPAEEEDPVVAEERRMLQEQQRREQEEAQIVQEQIEFNEELIAEREEGIAQAVDESACSMWVVRTVSVARRCGLQLLPELFADDVAFERFH